MATEVTERIVVQATSKEEKAIVEKARKLDVSISELMRRGARAYKSEAEDSSRSLRTFTKGSSLFQAPGKSGRAKI